MVGSASTPSDEDKIRKAIHSELGKGATRLMKRYKSRAPEILKECRRESSFYDRRRYRIWSEPLQLLEAFIQISLEMGTKYNSEERPRAASRNDFSFEVLTRLHGRACRIAQEVVLLLKSGFPAGAYARWRAIHEIAVTCSLIRKSGNELAERYLQHEEIERINAMRVNQQYHERIGMEPYSEVEIARANEMEATLVQRFGKGFKTEYGWAASILGMKRPTFKELEIRAGLDHLRPFYKLASDDIHAGAKGLKSNIGVIGEKSDFILAGPTDAGMSLPGQNTVISLMQINACMHSSGPKVEDAILLGALNELSREVCIAFANTEKEQEDRLSRQQSPQTIERPTFRFINS